MKRMKLSLLFVGLLFLVTSCASAHTTTSSSLGNQSGQSAASSVTVPTPQPHQLTPSTLPDNTSGVLTHPIPITGTSHPGQG